MVLALFFVPNSQDFEKYSEGLKSLKKLGINLMMQEPGETADFFSRVVIIKLGCFVRKYWPGTVTLRDGSHYQIG